MKYLLYCVFRTPEGRKPQSPTGVGGERVFLVAGNGLSAAVSKIASPELRPTVPTLLAYEKVVEWFYRKQAVIPLRYGAVFREKASIVALLRKRRGEYKQILRNLQDRAEMGIRALVNDPACRALTGAVSGTAYLAGLRQRYAEEARLAEAEGRGVNELRAQLSGLFVCSRTESRALSGKVLLSLHFLVAKEAVEEFRRSCRQIRISIPAKLLVSGPWPPYNFVSEMQEG